MKIALILLFVSTTALAGYGWDAANMNGKLEKRFSALEKRVTALETKIKNSSKDQG